MLQPSNPLYHGDHYGYRAVTFTPWYFLPALSGFFIFRVAGITLDALLVKSARRPLNLLLTTDSTRTLSEVRDATYEPNRWSQSALLVVSLAWYLFPS